MLKSETDKALPIFEAFPRLAESVPWRSIASWPTPIQRAERLGAAHGLSQLFIKREDLSHPIVGGNKLRGLEFLLADMVARRATRIVTLSSVGSHHIARTAYHAKQLGIDTTAVVVDQPRACYVCANLGLGLSSGARYVLADYASALPRLVFERLRPLNRRAGRPPYYIAPGGTNSLACIGHVNAAFELQRQIERDEMSEPDFIYVPMGSLGTAAGLVLGCKLAGLRARVVGIVVSHRWYCTRGRTLRLARRTLRRLRRYDPTIPSARLNSEGVEIVGRDLGKGYGEFTPEAARAAAELHAFEGVITDGTYAAKALSGMLGFIRDRALNHKVHLFWNTYHHLQGLETAGIRREVVPARLRAYFDLPVQPLDDQFPRPVH